MNSTKGFNSTIAHLNNLKTFGDVYATEFEKFLDQFSKQEHKRSCDKKKLSKESMQDILSLTNTDLQKDVGFWRETEEGLAKIYS